MTVDLTTVPIGARTPFPEHKNPLFPELRELTWTFHVPLLFSAVYTYRAIAVTHL